MRLILKKRKRKKFFCLVVFLFFVSIIFSIIFIKYYSNNIAPFIIDSSEDEIKRLMLLVINNSIGETAKKIDTNDLFITKYNSAGEIILIDFDSKKSSEVLNGITNLIEYSLKDIEEGNVYKFRNYYSDYNFDLLKRGIIVEVPFGTFFNSGFLNNLGPKIPVSISFTRNIETGFNTEVVEYGINNALLKLNVTVKIRVRVILPIVSDEVNTSFVIPVAMKVIQGKIPSYYINGFSTNSNIVSRE